MALGFSDTPRKNAMRDPSGDTDAFEPSSVNLWGDPPNTGIFHKLGFSGFSTRVTSTWAPSGNQLSTRAEKFWSKGTE
jgi:hypothetical protein